MLALGIMSADFRRFLARLAVDPEAYGQFLADPIAAARDVGLSDAQLDALTGGDQERMYAELTSDLVDGMNLGE